MVKKNPQEGRPQGNFSKNPKKQRSKPKAKAKAKRIVKTLVQKLGSRIKNKLKSLNKRQNRKKAKMPKMTKGRKQNKQFLSQVDSSSLRQLIDQGEIISEDFQSKTRVEKTQILQNYRQSMERVLGAERVNQYNKCFQQLNFSSIVLKIAKTVWNISENKNKKLENKLDISQHKNKKLEHKNKQLEHKSLQKEYYNEKKKMTLKAYKSFIQNYRESGNIVKVAYDQVDENKLFRWVKESNGNYKYLRKKQLQELHEKQQEKQTSSSEKRIIRSKIQMLETEGLRLYKEYIEDIKQLLKGGFLFDISEEDNLRLMADLLSYSFPLRYRAFFDHLKSSHYSNPFVYIQPKKQYRHYSQATIKNSSLERKEYFDAADQVIQSVNNSQKLHQQIAIYLNTFSQCKYKSKKISKKRVGAQLKKEIKYGLFDYDYHLNGITVCRDSQLKIYFNTYNYYNPVGEDEEIEEKQLNIFKTFIFFTYIHELAHYLIRSLKISGFQESSLQGSPVNKQKFNQQLGLNLQENKIHESGHMLQVYLFGKVITNIISSQYDDFLQAQKDRNIEIRTYFRNKEKQKTKKLQNFRNYPTLLKKAYRQNFQANYSIEIPFDKCGTNFDWKVKRKNDL